MRPAGSKNQGAWFRANKAIHGMSGADRVELGALIAQIPNSEPVFLDLMALAAETGVGADNTWPGDYEAWIAAMMAKGIPWQIWNGRLTFTTYSIVDDKLYANYQENLRQFASKMRRIVRKYIFAKRELNDVFDLQQLGTGNPGGLPDTNPET